MNSITLIFLLSNLSWSTLAHEGKIIQNCDYPVGTIESLKAKTAKACSERCVSTEACKAYTFISGWNKCFLKGKVGKRFSVKMKSGDKSLPLTPQGRLAIHDDKDHSGKDIKQAKNINSSQACASRCQTDTACFAFTYIDGYQTCWLKSRPGKLRNKVFYCGEKLSKSP